METTFDFGEALACLRADIPVELTINGVRRVYRMNHTGNIICYPNCKEELAYVVKTFYSDAILSTEWKHYESDEKI